MTLAALGSSQTREVQIGVRNVIVALEDYWRERVILAVSHGDFGVLRIRFP